LLVGFSTAACGSDGNGGGGTGSYTQLGGAGGALGGQGGLAGGAGIAGQGGLAGAGGSSGGGGSSGSGGLGGQGGSGGGPAPTITPGAADRFLLQGAVLAATGPMMGEVLIEGNLITCVAASCSAQSGAAGATIIQTNGVIMPGLLDSHNHGLFNVFDEDDWNAGKLFKNHTQWNPTSEPRYGAVVDAKQYLESVSAGANVSCELAKWAETKAIIAGTTSFLLAPGATVRKCYGTSARTIDTNQNGLPTDNVRTSISVPSTAAAKSACDAIKAGTTTAYVVHIAEGVDETSRKEFDALEGRENGCFISKETAITHGTGLTAVEFGKMAAAGMKLIWSPKSNDYLYGEVTNIPLAMSSGVTTIALAPDWALGGGLNMLEELRFADNWDNTKFGNVLSPERLFKMVTIDAAKALAVEQFLGSLEVGKRADVTVISGGIAAPYDDLLKAKPQSVRLVMVDGRVAYGDKVLQAAGPAAPGCEPMTVCGVDKFICLAENDSADKKNQTLAQVQTILETELTKYDTTQAPVGGPLSPLAPLFKCN
jgi:cytosine/adenosine deaminase-related metal-dependent hydrolase